MLIIAHRPDHTAESPINCPWVEALGFAGNDASVIFVKMKRNKFDLSIPDLDVDCTLQQVTAALSAEQVQMLLDLCTSLDGMIISPSTSPSPQETEPVEVRPDSRASSDLAQYTSPGNGHGKGRISLPEEDLYSNQPTSTNAPAGTVSSFTRG